MQLTKRQKTILLVGGGILFLTIFITTALIISSSQKKSSVSVSPQKPTPVPPVPEPTSLVDQQNQAISEIQTVLNAQSISSTTLVQKLIAQGKLQPHQTDWKLCLKDPLLTTKEQIINRKRELKVILDVSPGPFPAPEPDYPRPGPYPRPDIRPTNQWKGILWDINKFLGAELDPIIRKAKEIESKYIFNEKTVAKAPNGESVPAELLNGSLKGKPVPLKYYDWLVEDFPDAKSDKKKYEKLNEETRKKLNSLWESIITKNGEPLTGIDLKGIGTEKLNKIPGSVKVPGLGNKEKSFHNEYEYANWVQLSAAGDGNCFLHSYSVFLTGQSNLDLTLRLRVAMCLELIAHFEERYSSSYYQKNCLAENFKKEMESRKISENGEWASNFEIEILKFVLKRPLTVISKIPVSGIFQAYSSTPKGITDAYSEPWVIYNSGGHFQPLIKKD